MTHLSFKPPWRVPDSAATPESTYVNRRQFLRGLGVAGAMTLGACWSRQGAEAVEEAKVGPLTFEPNPEYADAGRPQTNEELVFKFNNFYEFGLGKTDPAKNAQAFKLDPYTLTIEGLVDTPLTLDLDDIRGMGLEERVYRFRCVEAWAMTVPWVGVPLHKILEKAGVKSDAKYIQFMSFHDPVQAFGQMNDNYPWPYHEALRLDEAMNELAFVAVGLYGKELRPQCGAPLRVVVPWKYGYKGPKSVVSMKLTEAQPPTFWNTTNSAEYKFYSNVDPEVPHPRWSQAKEQYLGERLKNRETQWYNGYGEQVAHLYANMPRTLY